MDLTRLAEHLLSSDADRLDVSFEQIERIVRGPLPPSAHRHQAWWSSGQPHAHAWTGAGFRTTFRGVLPGHVVFVRDRTLAEGHRPDRPRRREDRLRLLAIVSTADAVLVGCVAAKGSTPAPAKDLYQSELFMRRRAYAEASGRPWFILSTLHGLVEPDEVTEPYDLNMTEVGGEQQRAWVSQIVARLEELLGPLSGLVFEAHAGADYRDALEPALRRSGATLLNPLEGLRLGEQLHWYDTVAVPGPAASQPLPPALTVTRVTPVLETPSVDVGPTSRTLARRITDAFACGGLDLSKRPAVPVAGWEGMPEVAAAHELRGAGASDATVRLFMTFTAALDRARDADRLWASALALWRHQPWVFEPERVFAATLTELQDALRSSSVSQRHTMDTAVWRLIAETLVAPSGPVALREAVYGGVGDTVALLAALQMTTPAGTARTPMLAGPKVGPMWVRMLAYPGAAAISSLEVLPVAVDVQVRKVTEYLGLTDTRGQDLERVRGAIQEAWRRDVQEGGAVGPGALAGTCAALDPALWFFGKWGCTFCERSGQRRPIEVVCCDCRLDFFRP